jgi:phytoene dehydrogenase-like protein
VIPFILQLENPLNPVQVVGNPSSFWSHICTPATSQDATFDYGAYDMIRAGPLSCALTLLGCCHAFVVVPLKTNRLSEHGQLSTRSGGVTNADDLRMEQFDVVIVGAGLGGLCAGAILNAVYGKSVGIFESHYLAGGCAHAFETKFSNGQTFVFDSGPTILLGCSSSPPYNALRQVLDAVGESVDWIPYSGWGVIENPAKDCETRWRVDLGPNLFENGPLMRFGGKEAVDEFKLLQALTKDLVVGADIPAMAMRPGPRAIFPLFKYFGTFMKLIMQGEKLTGTFDPYMDGPLYKVKSPWLRNWLDALAFSLSGLPASRTAAAAMAFVLNDMHRPGAALDYPRGGMGSIVEALVRAVEKGDHGSKVFLKKHVASINMSNPKTRRITGVTIAKSGQNILARLGVICNAPIWTLRHLISDATAQEILNEHFKLDETPKTPTSWTTSSDGSSIGPRDAAMEKPTSFLSKCDTSEMTGSFIHLHLAIQTNGLDMQKLEAHYTVMDRGLSGDPSMVVNGIRDGPCGEANMIAVSNPCVIDPSLAPPGYAVIHAYGAGNEPYELWEDMERSSEAYKKLKEKRAAPLWRAVESIIPDVRSRMVGHLIGSPLTHERFLRRPRGTYGSATEDYLPNGSTPLDSLVLANDGVFPGIGVPAVAIAGASAANAFVDVIEQWKTLGELKQQGKL